MSTAPSPAAIQQLQDHFLKLSQNMDALDRKVMTSHGFSDVPAWWPDEADIVFNFMTSRARREAKEEIIRTAEVLRTHSFYTAAELATCFKQLDEKQTAVYRCIHAIYSGLVAEEDRLGGESRDAITTYLPSLHEKFTAFCDKLSSMRDEFFSLLPLYRILQSRPVELEATLAVLLRNDRHGELITTTANAVRQLYVLKTERENLLQQEAALRVASLSPDATSDQQDLAWGELRSLVGLFGNQVLNQRMHLDTIRTTAYILQNQFKTLHDVTEGVDISLQDIVGVFGRFKLVARTVEDLTEDVDLLVTTFDSLKNLIDIGNAVAGDDGTA